MRNNINEIYKFSGEVLTRDEEIDLALKAQAGDSHAMDRMVKANLRLVVYVAKSLPFWNLDSNSMEADDLIQEGNIALMKAINEWVPMHKIRFATFARQVIKSAIKRAYENQNTLIKIPIKKQETIRKLYYLLSKNPDATLADLARDIDKPIEQTAYLLRIMARSTYSIDAHLEGLANNE